MDEAPIAARKPRRGIYLLPNLFTTGAMFAGFYAIIAGIGGHYIDAAIAVFVAAVIDGLDGRAALRLARFNTRVGVADKRYVQGLASPAAAGLCMSFVLASEDKGLFGLNA